MSELDVDLLTGTIAARLRLMPDVARLYPARSGPRAIATSVRGLVMGFTDDSTVIAQPHADGYRIEASVGIASGVPALSAGIAAAALIRELAMQNQLPVRCIVVRLASID